MILALVNYTGFFILQDAHANDNYGCESGERVCYNPHHDKNHIYLERFPNGNAHAISDHRGSRFFRIGVS